MEELDLKEIFNIFWARKAEIAIIIIIAIFVGAIYSFILLKPKYTSSTTVLLTQVNSENKDNDSQITQTDITLNKNLLSTYSKLIESKAVLSRVITELGSIDNLSEDSLKKSIKVSDIADTAMISISVTNKDPNDAAVIANKIAEVFNEKISDIYKINNVYVVDRAEPNAIPSNINHVKDFVIFTFIGIVIACGYVLLTNMLDTTIKTEADIEKVTGLKILSSIPDYDIEVKGGKK